MELKELDKNVRNRVDQWLTQDYDKTTIQQLNVMIEAKSWEQITDSFYKDLEFGTGGLRGIMGVGPNRINRYTVGAATQGFSNFLLKSYPSEEISVVIAHDNRNQSDSLADLVADVFSANGILVYHFDKLRPTPELSFAVRHLGCKGGVMLTASHNPKEYNGYKAYGADGGQLVPPYDKQVIDEVRAIQSVASIKFEGNPHKKILLGAEVDDLYLKQIKILSLSPDAIRKQEDMAIVFSPIHGTGSVLVPTALKQLGFRKVSFVESQMVVDGNFPTVVYPNPEEKEAMTLAIKKADKLGATLAMATDPDADRVGIAVRNSIGDMILLNGNQTATLLVHYVLQRKTELKQLDSKHYVVKTIVTSYLLDKMAADFGIDCYNTLTGFKWIGEMMTRLHDNLAREFVVGGEESYGYLVGMHARDKDAVVSCAMIAEMAAYYLDNGSSLFETLQDIYIKYGFYKEKLISIAKKGKSGEEEIKAILDRLRNSPPTMLGGEQVELVKDYKTGKSKNLLSGNMTKLDLPSSNVLQFVMAGGNIVSVRPSGTEPKIKFYCSVNAKLNDRSEYDKVDNDLNTKIEKLMEDILNP